ncbi:MAG: hypothetical protein O7J95_20300 [Planctomycetota bacterium]|nr:hypothetical protein [Planctomycetota bacterium]
MSRLLVLVLLALTPLRSNEASDDPSWRGGLMAPLVVAQSEPTPADIAESADGAATDKDLIAWILVAAAGALLLVGIVGGLVYATRAGHRRSDLE